MIIETCSAVIRMHPDSMSSSRNTNSVGMGGVDLDMAHSSVQYFQLQIMWLTNARCLNSLAISERYG